MKRRAQRVALPALLVSVALIAAACGGDDGATETVTTEASTTEETTAPGTDAPAATDAPAPEGGCEATVPGTELRIGVFAPPASLDPQGNSGALIGGAELSAIYDVLTRWDPETNSWVPNLAESLEPNADFSEWTLTLRPGITYPDGTTMTAQNVLDNLVRMSGPGRDSVRVLVEWVDLEASEVVDDLTVIFRLKSPWADFGYLFGQGPGMIPNQALVAQVNESGVSIIGADPTNAGVGPYEVESYAPGEPEYLTLKAKADYWGGPVCIERVIFVAVPGDQAKLDALELDELDMAFMRTTNVIEEAKESGEYQTMLFLQSAGGLVLINNGIGTHNPITKDIRFRQAVSLAIDSQVISDRAFGGKLMQSRGLFAPDSVFYSGLPEVEPDLEEASRLVEELKAEGWDGKVRLHMPDPNPDLPIAIEASLEAVGMDVDLLVTDTTTQITAVAVDRDYDMAGWGWNISDSSFYQNLTVTLGRSPSAMGTAEGNRIGFINSEVDQAILDLFAAPDLAARQAVAKRLSEIFASEIPSVTYGAIEEGYIYSTKVQGIRPTQQSVILLDKAYLAD